MKLVKKIVSWVFVVFFFLLALTHIPSLAMILFALVGIALLPINPIDNLWDKVPKRKIIKPIAAIVLFFVAVVIAPKTTTAENEVAIESVVEETSIEETSNEETTEISLVLVEETQIESETEIEPESIIESTVEEVSESESTSVEETTEILETEKESNKVNEVKTELVSQPEAESQTVLQPESTPEQQLEVKEELVQQPAPESTPAPQPEANPQQNPTGSYAVNNSSNAKSNGKIHIVGACTATGTGDKAMKNPTYFNSYEEAEAYSIQIAPGQDKRRCGNCW